MLNIAGLNPAIINCPLVFPGIDLAIYTLQQFMVRFGIASAGFWLTAVRLDLTAVYRYLGIGYHGQYLDSGKLQLNRAELRLIENQLRQFRSEP